MVLGERLKLIERKTLEIIGKEIFVDLLEKKKKPVVYCGYELSGDIHLGHLVSMTKLLDLQKAGFIQTKNILNLQIHLSSIVPFVLFELNNQLMGHMILSSIHPYQFQAQQDLHPQLISCMQFFGKQPIRFQDNLQCCSKYQV